MYIVFITSLVCLFLTYLDSIGKLRKGLSFSFVLLSSLAAIHYNYGNDYMGYYDLYESLTYGPFDYKAIIEGDYKDYGWALLCYIFKPIGGFFTMVAVLSIMQNYFVFNFIRREVGRAWWAMSVFIYLFVTNYYLLNFSMLRQGFVVCVFLGLWTYIKNRRWWIPLVILSLCSTIHSSAKLLIPFSFWGFVPAKRTKVIAIIYGLLLILLLFSGTFLNSVLDSFLQIETFSEYADIYAYSQNSLTFRVGYFLGLIPFFIAEYYFLTTNDSSNNRQIVMLAMLSFIVIPFSAVIPLIGRISIYFGIYQLAALPLVFESIKKHQTGLSLIFLWICLTLFSYWAFFNTGVYVKSYRTFHTIFEVI